jgi:hypothetical protein
VFAEGAVLADRAVARVVEDTLVGGQIHCIIPISAHNGVNAICIVLKRLNAAVLVVVVSPSVAPIAGQAEDHSVSDRFRD